jgi:Holliday junction DNA helicase RuvA
MRESGAPDVIGKLKGVVDEIAEDHCVVDVHGVGYVCLLLDSRTLAALPTPGRGNHHAHVETYVREDMIRLYGFATPHWSANGSCLLLNNVQGVGAKVALAVLSTLTTADLANAIALRDIAMVARAPGVGKKVAERIVIELKNKAPAFSGAPSGTIGLMQELGEGVAAAPVADAVSALVNLATRATWRRRPWRTRSSPPAMARIRPS